MFYNSKRSWRRAVGAGATVGMLVLSLAGCSSASQGSAEDLTRVRFGIPSGMGTNNSPMAVAQHMGYFAEEGIELDLVVSTDATAILQGITSGNLEIGSTPPEPLMNAKLMGGEAGNVVMFYNYIREQTGSIAVLADGDISELSDLKGGVIGQASLGASNLLLSDGIMASVGLEPDKDYTHVAVGLGAAAMQALRTGEVDALSLWDTEYAAFEAAGTDLETFSTPEVEKLFSTTYYSTPEFVEEKAELAAGFGRAMAKATLFTSVNPRAALEIMYEDYPETLTAGTNLEDQLEKDLVGLEARVELLVAGDPMTNLTWGKYDPSTVQGWTDFAFASSIIPEAVNPDSLYTNALVEKYNDFDADEIVAEAEGWNAE